MRATGSRARTLIVGLVLAASVVGGIVPAATASAAVDDCLAVPGTSVRSGNPCTRWVVPFPNRPVVVPSAQDLPPNAVPARQLAPGEPAPSPFVNPLTIPVYVRLPDGRYTVFNPAVAPGAPIIGTATAGSGSATVGWAPPLDDGGTRVSDYTVLAYRGTTLEATAWADATERTAEVPGLTPGVAYTFTVVARNFKGTGPESARSTVVVPTATAPGEPLPGSVTSGNQWAQIRWSAPVSTGGSAITGYVVRVSSNGQVVRTVTAAATARSVRVDRLGNGTLYSVSIAARNAVGTGPEVVAPVVFAPRAERPGAPVVTGASAGRGSMTVRWAAPASNGGASVTGYEIRVYVRGVLQRTVPASASSRSLVVTNLLPGTPHTMTVTAVNSVGRGAASAHTSAITPTR